MPPCASAWGKLLSARVTWSQCSVAKAVYLQQQMTASLWEPGLMDPVAATGKVAVRGLPACRCGRLKRALLFPRHTFTPWTGFGGGGSMAFQGAAEGQVPLTYVSWWVVAMVFRRVRPRSEDYPVNVPGARKLERSWKMTRGPWVPAVWVEQGLFACSRKLFCRGGCV